MKLISFVVFGLIATIISTCSYANDTIDHSKEQTLPLCAHWTNAFVLKEFMRQAEVVGTKDQRLSIFKQNPDLCELDAVNQCTSSRYVISGDHVTVGHICGAWAHIEYGKKNSTTKGWVELARLKLLEPDSKTILQARKKYISPNVIESNSLNKAIFANDIRSIKKLIQSGKDATNALPVAVLSKNTEVVTTLLQLGARPNDLQNNCNLIMSAIHSNSDILNALLEAGGQVNCVGVQKCSPLKSLAMVNRADRPQWVAMGHLADPGVDEPEKIFSILKKFGAELNIEDAWDGTPLRGALENNNVDIAKLLLEAGADVNNYLDDSPRGDTILMEAIAWYTLRWDSSMIELLLQHGADVNYKNKDEYHDLEVGREAEYSSSAGQTALTIASSNGYLKVVKLLLEHGADPSIPRGDGKTAFQLAVENKHPEVSKLISDSLKKTSSN
jgi:ankyrin repeat protein